MLTINGLRNFYYVPDVMDMRCGKSLQSDGYVGYRTYILSGACESKIYHSLQHR